MTSPARSPQPNGPQLAQAESARLADGLANAQYLVWRCREECYRASRYGRPLALLVVELQEPDSPRLEQQLQRWLRSNMRLSDMPGYLGDGHYAILLPETDRAGAMGLDARLRLEFRHVKTLIGAHPQDNLVELLQSTALLP